MLLQLGSWVNLQDLRAAAVVSKQELPERAARQPSLDLPISAPEANKYSKKKRLAIEALQSMVKRPSTGLLTDSQLDSQIPILDPRPEPAIVDSPLPIEEKTDDLDTASKSTTSVPPAPPIDDVAVQPTAMDIFDNIRTHYLEALYLSKVSYASMILRLFIDLSRHRWHISPKDPYLGLGLPSTWTMTLILT